MKSFLVCILVAASAFAQTLTGTSHAAGTLTLSDGTKVIFANNSVDVKNGSPTKRRAVRR